MHPTDVDRIARNIRARLDELGDIQEEIRLLEAAIAALDSIDDAARPARSAAPAVGRAPRAPTRDTGGGRTRAPRGQNWHRISGYLEEVRRPAGAKELSESTGIALATMYATLSKSTQDGRLRRTDEGYELAPADPTPAAEPEAAEPEAPPAEPVPPAEPEPAVEAEQPAEPTTAAVPEPQPEAAVSAAAPIKERVEEEGRTRSPREPSPGGPKRSRRSSGMKAAAFAVIDVSPGIGAAAISERTGANVVALEIVLDKAVENGELLAIDDGYALPSEG